MSLLLCWMNATFTTHSSSLHPLKCIVLQLCSFGCLYDSSFSSRLNTLWGWGVAALSSCCSSYISSGDHFAADELDQRSVTSDYWLLQKNCVWGLAPTHRKGWKQEDGTGWNLGQTFHSITQPNWLNLVVKLQRKWDMWNDPFQKHLQIWSFFFFLPYWPTLQQLHKQLHQHTQGRAELWYKDLSPQSKCVDSELFNLRCCQRKFSQCYATWQKGWKLSRSPARKHTP